MRGNPDSFTLFMNKLDRPAREVRWHYSIELERVRRGLLAYPVKLAVWLMATIFGAEYDSAGEACPLFRGVAFPGGEYRAPVFGALACSDPIVREQNGAGRVYPYRSEELAMLDGAGACLRSSPRLLCPGSVLTAMCSSGQCG